MDTPRRIYQAYNICLICSFSFINIEVTTSGRKYEVKHLKQKLRLNEERVATIKKVIPDFAISEDDKVNGICTRCYKQFEKVLTMEANVIKLQESLKSTYTETQTRKKTQREKRLPKSPAHGQVESKSKKFPTEVIVRQKQTLAPFHLLTISGHNPLQTGLQPVQVTEIHKASVPVEIAPKPIEYEIKDVSDTLPVHVKKTAKRYLGFSEKENIPEVPIPTDGSVEVSVYYPSGKRSTVITNSSYKTICKAFFKGENADKIIVETLCKSNPMEITKGSASVIQEECQKMCKRGANTALQKKDLDDILTFKWEQLYEEFDKQCPNFLTVISSAVCDTPTDIGTTKFLHILLAIALALHGRSQDMSLIQYITGFISAHGGCTLRDIERLAHLGLTVHPVTVQRKLMKWENILDKEVLEIRNSWANGGTVKYQLIGDNWDKNILPSYRTSDRKTVSLHLFNVYAIIDRIVPNEMPQPQLTFLNNADIQPLTFLPSVQEQELLMKEMCFHFSTSIIQNLPQLNEIYRKIYPKHLEHEYSQYAGLKTCQYPLGLFDCNETRTNEVIQLMKELSAKYVPCKDGKIVESVFFGGCLLLHLKFKRLLFTCVSENVQIAQEAMRNNDSPLEKLEGFISKIEDFHRLMNFLEAIHKMTFSTQSKQDRCSVYYFRTLLNMRNVKGHVCNAYRPYKMLYYAILDAICLMLFLNYFEISNIEEFVAPETLKEMTDDEKINWINSISKDLLTKWFFEEEDDICKDLKDMVGNPEHPENYWTSTIMEDGRLKCHVCDRTYAYVGSLQTHEKKHHNVTIEKSKQKKKEKGHDDLQEYILMLFKLTMLHKNLDTAVDMGDGQRVVRSAKYELPLYNLTNKTKYLIGSVHLTALASGLLPEDQRERFVYNRFVNLHGGKNNNISLDEYLEMLNRDSKVACTGHQTKESIIKHSKGYPHIVNIVKHIEEISNVKAKKGFHHLPSYKEDVKKILKELTEQNVLEKKPNRALTCKSLVCRKNPYNDSYRGLSTMIHRHKPNVPFHRLRDHHI